MTNKELAKEIALGIIQTKVEGYYNSVSCSSIGDYPSLGISQWEGINGGRGDILLSYIDGGSRFSNRRYSDIARKDELQDLKNLLDSKQGREAQQIILTQDCLDKYVPKLEQIETLDDSRCFIYAGIWCPTSEKVVYKFIKDRQYTYNFRSLLKMNELFKSKYYIVAKVGYRYKKGYENRADKTYQYVAGIDLSAYDVPTYGEAGNGL